MKFKRGALLRALGKKKAYVVNSGFRLRVVPAVVLYVGCTLLSGGLPLVSVAAGSLTPYVAEDLEHNTNIFSAPSGTIIVNGAPANSPSDTFLQSRVGLEGLYKLDQQQFFGTAEFRHLNYDRFTSLDHNEYLLDAGLNYRLNEAMDGILEYRREQRMVQFQDLIAATGLIVENESNANVRFNVNVTPEWRIESHFRDHVLDSPRSDVPQLSLHEDSIREGLRYIGMSNLSAGLDAEYLKGIYRHDPFALNPNYHQTSVFLAANYIVSGQTNFTGDIGYTKRTDPTNNGTNTGDASGITGDLLYRHSLSGKTTLNLGLRRGIATYLTTGGNEIDSTASAGATFQATYKIALTGSYEYTISKFANQSNGTVPGQGPNSERQDHFRTANLQATWQALHWLSIRPYARYQKRSSNLQFTAFDSTAVGIEFIAKPTGPNR